jgi:hypothetical protein
LRVAREEETACARLVADRGDLFLGVGELLRAARRERLVAREQELDRVDARFRHLAHVGAHRRGAARMLRAFLAFRPSAPSGSRSSDEARSLGPGIQPPLISSRSAISKRGPSEPAGVGAGESASSVTLAFLGRDQEVLLGRQDHGVDDAADRRGPRRVRVRFDEALASVWRRRNR